MINKSNNFFVKFLLRGYVILTPSFFIYSCVTVPKEQDERIPRLSSFDKWDDDTSTNDSEEERFERIKEIIDKDVPKICYRLDGTLDETLRKDLNYNDVNKMRAEFRRYAKEIQESTLIKETTVKTKNRKTQVESNGIVREYLHRIRQANTNIITETKYLCFFDDNEECTAIARFYENCYNRLNELGIGHIKKTYSDFSETSSGYIDIMVVKENARGNGISKVLLEAIHDRFKAKNLKYSTLYTYNKGALSPPNNKETTAHKLYISKGYKNIIDWASFYSKTNPYKNNNTWIDKTYMVKKL